MGIYNWVMCAKQQPLESGAHRRLGRSYWDCLALARPSQAAHREMALHSGAGTAIPLHQRDMIINDLTDSVENSYKDIEDKTVEKQRKAGKTALDKKRPGATIAVKAANGTTLQAKTT